MSEGALQQVRQVAGNGGAAVLGGGGRQRERRRHLRRRGAAGVQLGAQDAPPAGPRAAHDAEVCRNCAMVSAWVHQQSGGRRTWIVSNSPRP